MPDIRYLLWDFGDTLVDERFLWACPADVPEWADVYRSLAGGPFGSRWNCGTATFAELAREMAAQLGMTEDAVVAHARRCCGDIHFFEHPWAAARAHELSQALVTVNADVFRDLVMANYPIEEAFDAVVISAEVGVEGKAEMCELATARLGCDDPAQALLIDNLQPNVDAWRALGGAAYWFRGDEQFASDLQNRGWHRLAGG